MRRLAGLLTSLVAIAAAGAVAAGPSAAAPARTLDVPVFSYESGVGGVPQPSGLLRVRIRVPDGGRVWAIPEDDAGGLIVRRGACTARIVLGAELDRPTPRADGPPARQRIRATVTGSNGARHRAAAWGSGAVRTEAGSRSVAVAVPAARADPGIRAAIAVVRLPALVLHRMPYRELVVLAEQASLGKHCTTATWDAIIEDALRTVDLRVTGTYLPDNPAPVLDVDALPHLTIAGTGGQTWFGDNATAVGDTDGDGRPELAVTYGWAVGQQLVSELHLVNLGGLTGSASIADPATTTLVVSGPGAQAPRPLDAGDVDGDGLADLLLDTGEEGTDRSILLVRGRRGGGTVDLADPAAAFLTVLAAPPGPGNGPDVTSAVAPGDVDGDGHPDLVVTATANPGATPRRRGPARVWLVSGADQPGPVVLGESPRARVLAQADATIVAVGDVNGDGLADLGTSGRVGADGSWAGVLFSSATDRGPVALDAPGARGIVVRSADCPHLWADGPVGDVDGDGHADLIIDGPEEERGDDVAPGAVLFGGAEAAVLSPGELVPSGRGLTVDLSLQAAGGDRNGDGLADLLANDGDAAYVVYGHRGPAAIQIRRLGAGGQRVKITLGPPVVLIDALVAVPDADGDGRPELAFGGQHMAIDGRPEQGGVVVLGSRAG
jgi:hypothetical protein